MNTKRGSRTIHKLSPGKVTKADAGKYCDGGGLWLVKYNRATGRWAYRYQFGGKSHELGLGSINTVNLTEAREEAKQFRKLAMKGIDPLADRRATTARQRIEEAKTQTFRDCARQYIEDHRAGWTNAQHERQWTQSLTDYAYPVIGDLAVASIGQDAVKQVLQQSVRGVPFWKAHPETASRVRSRIEQVLGAAKASGKRDGDNPASWDTLKHSFDSRKKTEKGKKRHLAALPYRELPGFMAALRAREAVAARALEFTILTAARSSEARSAVWEEIDLPNKMWTVPAFKMKAKEEHRVPLSDRALEILEIVKGEGKYVFPGRGAVLSNMTLRSVLASLRPGFTVHGFRSSFTDWAMEATEYPREVREMALAHKVGSETEEAYRRTKLFDRRRKIMDDWAAYCAGKTGTVLQFAQVG